MPLAAMPLAAMPLAVCDNKIEGQESSDRLNFYKKKLKS